MKKTSKRIPPEMSFSKFHRTWFFLTMEGGGFLIPITNPSSTNKMKARSLKIKRGKRCRKGLSPCCPSSYFMHCTLSSRFGGSNYHTHPYFESWFEEPKSLQASLVTDCWYSLLLSFSVLVWLRGLWYSVPFCNSCSCTINLFWYNNHVTNMPK